MQGEAALTVLAELRAMGVSLALDDFGAAAPRSPRSTSCRSTR
jgi:predicted signal transduction protein with EAL and GGDEF domain